MLRIKFISFLVGLLFIFGCEEPIDLDLKQAEEQIVVLSEFSPDEAFKVVVTKSNGILSDNTLTNEPNYVLDAEVKILKDGRINESLFLTREESGTNSQKRLLHYSGQDPIRDRSGIYEIQVTVPGFETVSSFDGIPEVAAPINSFTRLSYNENSNELNLKLEFEHLETNAFYHLVLTETLRNLEENETSVFPLDFVMTDSELKYINHFGNGVLIKGEDLLFGNNQLNFKSRLFLLPELNQRIIAELRTVSENYFNYHSSLSFQSQQRDSIVSRPVVLFNNIENGLGNFAGYNYLRDSLLIVD